MRAIKGCQSLLFCVTAISIVTPNCFGQIEFGEPRILGTLPFPVWSPSITPDGLELYYTTNARASNNWDIHYATRANDSLVWTPQGIIDSVSVASRVERPTFTPDGLTMIFGSNQSGTNDLWTSTRADKDAEWQTPTPVPNVSERHRPEGAPALSPDGLTLFVGGGWRSDEKLLMSTRESLDGEWTTPVIIPGFEEVGDANYPTISQDQLTIVYSRGEGLTVDLWFATRESPNGPFENHEPLEQFNTSNVDSFAYFDGNDNLLFVQDTIPNTGMGWDIQYTGPELQFSPLDFRPNGTIDVGDLESLCTSVARDRFSEERDLNGDGLVNAADIDVFLTEVGSVRGDANLDGDVDVQDFTSLSAGFAASGSSRWSRSDFDCNLTTDVSDFLALSRNFGFSSAANATAATVPEPGFSLMSVMALVGLVRALIVPREPR